MKTRRMVSTNGAHDLSQQLVSWLLSHNCWSNEAGTVSGFTVDLHCDAAEVEVHVRKDKDNYKEDGTYSHSDYTVIAFTVRQCSEDNNKKEAT
jgi:hypothetical protein